MIVLGTALLSNIYTRKEKKHLWQFKIYFQGITVKSSLEACFNSDERFQSMGLKDYLWSNLTNFALKFNGARLRSDLSEKLNNTKTI